MFDYRERRDRLGSQMEHQGVDLLFVPPSGDLEYLTGMQRRVVTFGEIAYTHGWVGGAFLKPGEEPVFVLPRMTAEFDLPEGVPGDVVIVSESDDGPAVFSQVARRLGPVSRLAIGARTWGETVMHLLASLGQPELVNGGDLVNRLRRVKSPDELAALGRACRMADDVMAAVSDRVVPGVTELDLAAEVSHAILRQGSRAVSFDTGVWQMGPHDDRDATVRVSAQPLRAGTGVSFDFGAVADGYCSDFGRTIHVGEPDAEYVKVYELVMAAQAAGVAAVRRGATAADVDRATRQVIADGGYGEWFRHRTGHCIGLDVHEKPYISEEDETPLEAGMTFTIEPSVFWPGRVGVRVEDIVVCDVEGGRKLNTYPTDLVANT
ncbi:MAG: aminopeptidase P family protein [Euzebyales bacterium]|nr:aminopeptidase P family protein [Euzebyales bacterium]